MTGRGHWARGLVALAVLAAGLLVAGSVLLPKGGLTTGGRDLAAPSQSVQKSVRAVPPSQGVGGAHAMLSQSAGSPGSTLSGRSLAAPATPQTAQTPALSWDPRIPKPPSPQCPAGQTPRYPAGAKLTADGDYDYEYVEPDGSTVTGRIISPSGLDLGTASDAQLKALGIPSRPTGQPAFDDWLNQYAKYFTDSQLPQECEVSGVYE